eukprot:gene17593-9232_t
MVKHGKAQNVCRTIQKERKAIVMSAKVMLLSTVVLCLSILILRYAEVEWLEDFANSSIRKLIYLVRYDEQPVLANKSELNLELVDMTKAKHGDRKMEVAKLNKALSEVGFAYIINIPGYDPDKLLYNTKWFFSLPHKTKMEIAKNSFQPGNKNSFRGYFPIIDGGHSFKEALEFGAFFHSKHEVRKVSGTDRPLMRDVVQEPNVWPVSDSKESDEEFRNCMTRMYDLYSSLGDEVSKMMAEGLGLEKNYFDNLFKPGKPLATLRLLHYPTRINDTDLPEEAKDGDIRITTGEHFDTTFLTILATFENKGLQVKLTDDGPWLDVPVIKDGLIINTGALLSKMVDYKLRATNHRVIDLGADRYSVPFFYEPAFDADISKSISGKIINTAFPKYGPWMTNRTSMFAEYATTDFGIAD